MTVVLADWLDFAPSLSPASVDMLYADPPFNTGDTQSDRNGSYADAFPSTAAYIAWLRERLLATLPALKPTASILVHVDWRTSHHVRLLLDELLGADRFVNHLVWHYGLGGSSPRRFARKHDDILFYCVDPDRYWFEPPMVPATSQRMKGQLKKATDVLDVPSINNMAAERVGYPTQKPLALLELLIRACCPPGGTVLDPCCGSGTTLVAATIAGRVPMGCDANPDAVRITRERLDKAEAPPIPQPEGRHIPAQAVRPG
jgi:DNA modification methylase